MLIGSGSHLSSPRSSLRPPNLQQKRFVKVFTDLNSHWPHQIFQSSFLKFLDQLAQASPCTLTGVLKAEKTTNTGANLRLSLRASVIFNKILLKKLDLNIFYTYFLKIILPPIIDPHISMLIKR